MFTLVYCTVPLLTDHLPLGGLWTFPLGFWTWTWILDLDFLYPGFSLLGLRLLYLEFAISFQTLYCNMSQQIPTPDYTSLPPFSASDSFDIYLRDYFPQVFRTLSATTEVFTTLQTSFIALPTTELQAAFFSSFIVWLDSGIIHDTNRIISLEERLTTRDDQIADLNHNLVHVSSALATATATAATASASTITPPTSSKTTDPKHFSGDGKASSERQQKFRTWRQAIVLKMFTDRRSFPTEQDKIVYTVGRLEGRAAALTGGISRMVEKAAPFETWPWTTLESLIGDLAKQFDAQDPEGEADQALAKLDMSGKYADWPDFFAEFSKLHTFLDYDNRSKVSQLQQKVSQALAERVSHQLDTPDNSAFDPWVTLYAKAWDKIQQLKARRSNNNSTGTSDNATPPASSSSTPMDLDYIRRLDPIERQRRYETGACYYCGELGHGINTCHLKQQNESRRASGRGRGYRASGRGASNASNRQQAQGTASNRNASQQSAQTSQTQYYPRARGWQARGRGGVGRGYYNTPYQVNTMGATPYQANTVGAEDQWPPPLNYTNYTPGFVLPEPEASSDDTPPPPVQQLKD